jgi:hypothetical protein
MDHITIKQIRSDLEQKRGEPYSDEQFKMLLSGFSSRAQRQGLYTARAIQKALQRGWMTAQMTHFFKRYAVQ